MPGLAEPHPATATTVYQIAHRSEGTRQLTRANAEHHSRADAELDEDYRCNRFKRAKDEIRASRSSATGKDSGSLPSNVSRGFHPSEDAAVI